MNKFTFILLALMLLLASLTAQELEADFYAADQSVFVLPTAFTMPARSSALTNFEIILLQYSYAATNRLHLSAGMVFPIDVEVLKTFTAGLKYRYYTHAEINSAAWLSYNPHTEAMIVGNVLTWGKPENCLNLALGGAFSLRELDDSQFFVGLGGIHRLGSRVMAMAEILVLPPGGTFSVGDGDTFTAGIIGVRFKGEKISWDLGGARSLSEDMGNLIFLPFVKATFIF